MRNLRSRLYLLVIITTIPFIFYTGFSHYQNLQIKKNNELTRLSEIARLTAAQHKQITEGVRQLLIAIAASTSLTSQSPENCSIFLATLLSSYIRYENFGIVDSSGHVRCAANLAKAQQNTPHEKLIAETLSSGSFTVGAYYQTKPSGAVINFAYPISSTELVYASLSLDWVSTFVNDLNKTSSLVINILDRDGTVLARSPQTPEALGKNFANDPLVQEILTQGSGQTLKVGIDQVERLYAFTALDDSRSTFIAVGTPQYQIYTAVRNSLYVSLLTILSITAISFALAYKIGQVLIVKQIETLESIDKLKDEFVSLASHQIRSPLTAIRWLSESLLDVEPSQNHLKVRTTLRKIHSTTLRLITLTSQLLNISRLEAGSLIPHLKSISLRELILPVVHESKTGYLRRRSIKLDWKVPATTLVTTDPLLLKEALLVVIGNALKYSDPNTPIEITIYLRLKQLQISIKNLGIGIPSENSSHLFTRFYRGDNARLHHPDGNGLGLYLARLIMTKLNGSITYTSHKDGTIFTLSLPNEVS